MNQSNEPMNQSNSQSINEPIQPIKFINKINESNQPIKSITINKSIKKSIINSPSTSKIDQSKATNTQIIFNEPTNQTVNQPINQIVNQSTNQPIKVINQINTSNQSRSTNQSTNRTIQPLNQPKKSTNQKQPIMNPNQHALRKAPRPPNNKQQNSYSSTPPDL